MSGSRPVPTTPAPIRLLLLTGFLGLLLVASARAQETRPRSEREPVRRLEAVPRHALSRLNNRVLRTRHPRPTGPGPLRFAEPRPTALRAHTDGTWEALDDGTQLWRLRVQSGGALSLNLGFKDVHLPPGARLFLHGPDYDSVVGPFTSADNEAHGELWTPAIPGDEVVIEVEVPAAQKAALKLTLGQVNHGFRSLRPTAQSAAAKSSGACNVDVACEEANEWRNQVRAVGRYTTSDGILCTGVLVNNTANDWTPYFLTANHCGVTPENASSVVVYWNYENPTCRPPAEDGGEGSGELDQFTTGAIHRAGYGFGASPNAIAGRPDFTLIEIDDPILAEFDIRFAGWDHTAARPMESVTIHHPQGQEKRISFDEDPATVTSYLQDETTDAPTHLRVANWDLGTTEPGSSGAPLFDANHRIVGVLSGGFAKCSAPDASDWYGRLAEAWLGGGTPETSLAPWLDPEGTGAMTLDGIDIEDDFIPPGSIEDLTVEEIAPDGITLRWTAPGDDEYEGTAARYELRYSTAPITSPAAFDTARVVNGLSAPQPAQRPEQFTVQGLRDDQPYFFAIVARDNVNNASPIASTQENAIILEDPFTVHAGYPNPFRTTTTVGFAVKESQRVRVDLYDALGRHVQHLYDDTPSANNLQQLRIDAGPLASGVYFVHIVGEDFARTTQVVLAR